MTEEIVKDTETTIAEKKEQEAIDLKAHNLLIQGKRNLVCNEIPQAVNELQEACKLLAEKYGETAIECGEAYFCYGKALLDLARMESGVLGNALEGVSADTEDEKEETEKSEEKEKEKGEKEEEKEMTAEEREKISDEVIDAMLEKDDEKKPKETESTEDKKTDTETKTETNGHGEASIETNGQANGAKAEENEMETDEKKEAETKEKKEEDTDKDEGTGEEGEAEDEGTEEGTEEEEETAGDGEVDGKENEEEEEDVSNIQLAWEMLDLAKVIYKKQEEKEMQLKAAEAHLKLGEVSIESEQYEKAVEDFGECLKIQKAILECDDRLLAETYYQLGLALAFHGKHDEAIENYKNAMNVIEAKQVSLKKIVEESEKTDKGKAPEDSDDPVAKAHKELNELKEILPDIQAKIEDAEEEKKNLAQMKQMVKEGVAGDLISTQTGFGSGDASSSSSTDKKAAEDISHLVRRKRKPEDDEEEATKKPRQGDGDAKEEPSKKEESMETEKADETKASKSETETKS